MPHRYVLNAMMSQPSSLFFESGESLYARLDYELNCGHAEWRSEHAHGET